MKRVFYRLLTTLFALGLLISCNENAKLGVERVEPPEGINAGGDHVNIIGSGFQPGKAQARVMFGKHVCEQVVISSTNKISVVTKQSHAIPQSFVSDTHGANMYPG